MPGVLPIFNADAITSEKKLMDNQTNSPYPNLIYVFTDQLRYQSCGFAGDPKAYTPIWIN